MSTTLLVLEILAYSLALWLGLYLIARDLGNPSLRYAGLGLVVYALSLALAMLARYAPTITTAELLTRLHWSMLFLPAFFWLGTITYLLPQSQPTRSWLVRAWEYVLLPVAIPLYILTASANLVLDFSQGTGDPQPGPAYWIFVVAVVVPLLVALFFVWQTFRAAGRKTALGLLLVATIFVALGAGLLTYPFSWLPRTWLLVGISMDFIALGIAIALLDAFEEGESFLPHFARSFDAALLFVLLFGGLVVLTMMLSTGITFPMLVLLLTIIAGAICTQTFSDPLQTALDKLSFAAFPQLRHQRVDLRTTANILPRIDESLDPNTMDNAEFDRLTRRALSHLGNLPRLATSPLTRLAIVQLRLAERNGSVDTLERATELKRLLTESIDQLKPPGDADFGTSDEWRYYNALYFPYVAGLKPYSRRVDNDDLDPASKEALDWFKTYVPERTLYNWQNAAARLVAQNLREKTPAN